MEKVFLIIEFANDNCALMYTGAVYGNNIYVKLKPSTNNPKTKYIKISKDDIEDITKDIQSSLSSNTKFLCVKVADIKSDRRFLVVNSLSNEILNVINNAI